MHTMGPPLCVPWAIVSLMGQCTLKRSWRVLSDPASKAMASVRTPIKRTSNAFAAALRVSAPCTERQAPVHAVIDVGVVVVEFLVAVPDVRLGARGLTRLFSVFGQPCR
jgi:hypothetical protein